METTLVILKPSSIQRALAGKILSRFEQKGLRIAGLKMMMLDRPFFPSLILSMTATPVIVAAISGVEAVQTVRQMTGATNSRKALPGTIRGDFSMSGQENVIHASDSPENAAIELARFFCPEELYDYSLISTPSLYAPDELTR